MSAPLFILAIFGEAFIQVVADTRLVKVDVTPGSMVQWKLSGGLLLECEDVLGGTSTRSVRLGGDSSIAISGKPALAQATASQEGLSIAVSTNGPDVVLEFFDSIGGSIVNESSTTGCKKEAGPSLQIEDGDDEVRRLKLPVMVRLSAQFITEPIALDFRGGVVVGEDLAGGPTKLLESGEITIKWVRSRWLKVFKPALAGHYDVSAIPVGKGDKVVLHANGSSSQLREQTKGFLILQTKDDKAQVSVHAVGTSANMVIVKPLTEPETPSTTFLKRLSEDKTAVNILSVYGVILPIIVTLPWIWSFLALALLGKPGNVGSRDHDGRDRTEEVI